MVHLGSHKYRVLARSRPLGGCCFTDDILADLKRRVLAYDHSIKSVELLAYPLQPGHSFFLML